MGLLREYTHGVSRSRMMYITIILYTCHLRCLIRSVGVLTVPKDIALCRVVTLIRSACVLTVPTVQLLALRCLLVVMGFRMLVVLMVAFGISKSPE